MQASCTGLKSLCPQRTSRIVVSEDSGCLCHRISIMKGMLSHSPATPFTRACSHIDASTRVRVCVHACGSARERGRARARAHVGACHACLLAPQASGSVSMSVSVSVSVPESISVSVRVSVLVLCRCQCQCLCLFLRLCLFGRAGQACVLVCTCCLTAAVIEITPVSLAVFAHSPARARCAVWLCGGLCLCVRVHVKDHCCFSCLVIVHLMKKLCCTSKACGAEPLASNRSDTARRAIRLHKSHSCFRRRFGHILCVLIPLRTVWRRFVVIERLHRASRRLAVLVELSAIRCVLFGTNTRAHSQFGGACTRTPTDTWGPERACVRVRVRVHACARTRVCVSHVCERVCVCVR